MQTSFSPLQLADPHMRESEKILRSCVHCGFCTATCPTYLLLGDELDSPRGRIYLIKDMLENGKPATPAVVKHIDRCLSCLSCMTTCPSGVHYMHLVDHARAYIETTYRRPIADRLMRRLLALVLPHPAAFRLALLATRVVKPFHGALKKIPLIGDRVSAMLDLAPHRLPSRSAMQGPGDFAPPSGAPQCRVALLIGCAQPVLDPAINDATIRLLNRLGIAVVLARGEGCCGALVHHLGLEKSALGFAKKNIDAWMREIDDGGLAAILITASGCGTTIKDYGFMLRDDPAYAAKAQRVSALAMDITEFLGHRAPSDDLGRTLPLPLPLRATGLIVAYHSACSLQHGQKIADLPKKLLRAAGFAVKDVPEGHICCGSAGTYNILQPTIAGRLRARKVANIQRTKPHLVVTGNLGCITQIGRGFKESGPQLPILHIAELLDWAYGGPLPDKLEQAERVRTKIAAE